MTGTIAGMIVAGMTATIIAIIADGTEIVAGTMIDGIGVATTIEETGGDTAEATDSSSPYKGPRM